MPGMFTTVARGKKPRGDRFGDVVHRVLGGPPTVASREGGSVEFGNAAASRLQICLTQAGTTPMHRNGEGREAAPWRTGFKVGRVAPDIQQISSAVWTCA